MTLRDQGITDPTRWAKENGIQTVPPMEKHRYFQFVGDKRQRRLMLRKLAYPVVSQYPKSPRSRYDDGGQILMPYQQEEAFLPTLGKWEEAK
jgi:hypothetical protein